MRQNVETGMGETKCHPASTTIQNHGMVKASKGYTKKGSMRWHFTHGFSGVRASYSSAISKNTLKYDVHRD
jgi:hypothetical protein